MTLPIILASTALLGILAFIVKLQHQGWHMSISQHAALRRRTYILFGVALTLFGSALIVFLYFSLGPTLGVPDMFYVFVVVAWISLILTAWVPDTGRGLLNKIHWATSMTLACMMMLITASVVFANNINGTAQVMAAIVTVWFCFTLFLFFFVKRTHMHFLIYQVVNIVAFFLVIMTAMLLI